MAYQNLFEALQNVCGFTALESDMFEIINAYEKDKSEQLPQADVIKSVCPDCNSENVTKWSDGELTCYACKKHWQTVL